MYPENKKMAKGLGTTGLGEPKAPHGSRHWGCSCAQFFGVIASSCTPSPPHPLPPPQLQQNPSSHEAETTQLTHSMARGAGSSLGSHGTRLALQEPEKRRNDRNRITHPGLEGERAEQSRWNTSAPRSPAEPWPPGLSLPGPRPQPCPRGWWREKAESQPEKAKPCPFRLMTQQPIEGEPGTTLPRREKVRMCPVGPNLPQKGEERKQPCC